LSTTAAETSKYGSHKRYNQHEAQLMLIIILTYLQFQMESTFDARLF